MDENYKKNSVEVLKSFTRDGNYPLDETTLFKSLEEANGYIQTDPSAYPGQLISIDNSIDKIVEVYKVDYDFEDTTKLILSKVGNSDAAVTERFTYLGEVTAYGDLPEDSELGVMYFVESDNIFYANTEDGWTDISELDIDGLTALDANKKITEDITNKKLKEYVKKNEVSLDDILVVDGDVKGAVLLKSKEDDKKIYLDLTIAEGSITPDKVEAGETYDINVQSANQLNNPLHILGKKYNGSKPEYITEISAEYINGVISRDKLDTDHLVNKSQLDNYDTAEVVDEKIQILTDSVAETYVTKTEAVGVYKFKGSKETWEDLENLTGMVSGDVYNLQEAHGNHPKGTNYAWDAEEKKWDALGGEIDLTDFATLTQLNEKVNPSDLSTAISEHDIDEKSHIDIRSELETKISISDSNTNLLIHNADNTAHNDIRNLINTKPDHSDISDVLEEHDTSKTAHAHIRGLIDAKPNTEYVNSKFEEAVSDANIYTDGITNRLSEDISSLDIKIDTKANSSELIDHKNDTNPHSEILSKKLDVTIFNTHETNSESHKDIQTKLEEYADLKASDAISTINTTLAGYAKTSDIIAEINERTAADSALQLEINKLKPLEQTISTEIQNRISGDDDLSRRIGINTNELKDIIKDVTYDNSKHIISFTRLVDGNTNTFNIDLPIESLIMDVELDDDSKSLLITLQDGKTITVALNELFNGLILEDTVTDMIDTLESRLTNLLNTTISNYYDKYNTDLKISAAIAEGIKNHNELESSHPDIREDISDIVDDIIGIKNVDAAQTQRLENIESKATTDISTINTALLSKADKSELNAHSTSPDSHKNIQTKLEEYADEKTSDAISTINTTLEDYVNNEKLNTELSTKVGQTDVNESISTHNMSVNAHPDIRVLIENKPTKEYVDNKIAEHNAENIDMVHPKIMAEIGKKISTTDSNVNLLSHDTNPTAHNDIRVLIDAKPTKEYVDTEDAKTLAAANEHTNSIDTYLRYYVEEAYVTKEIGVTSTNGAPLESNKIIIGNGNKKVVSSEFAIDDLEKISNKNKPNGYVGLMNTGKIDNNYIDIDMTNIPNKSETVKSLRATFDTNDNKKLIITYTMANNMDNSEPLVIDLPIEDIAIENGYYDSDTNDIVLELTGNDPIRIPVGSLLIDTARVSPGTPSFEYGRFIIGDGGKNIKHSEYKEKDIDDALELLETKKDAEYISEEIRKHNEKDTSAHSGIITPIKSNIASIQTELSKKIDETEVDNLFTEHNKVNSDSHADIRDEISVIEGNITSITDVNTAQTSNILALQRKTESLEEKIDEVEQSAANIVEGFIQEHEDIRGLITAAEESLGTSISNEITTREDADTILTNNYNSLNIVVEQHGEDIAELQNETEKLSDELDLENNEGLLKGISDRVSTVEQTALTKISDDAMGNNKIIFGTDTNTKVKSSGTGIVSEVTNNNSNVPTAEAVYKYVNEKHNKNENAHEELFSTKQDLLISGTNIKTINGETILGAGDIVIEFPEIPELPEQVIINLGKVDNIDTAPLNYFKTKFPNTALVNPPVFKLTNSNFVDYLVIFNKSSIANQWEATYLHGTNDTGSELLVKVNTFSDKTYNLLTTGTDQTIITDSKKNIQFGYAGLDNEARILKAQLPTDVVYVADLVSKQDKLTAGKNIIISEDNEIDTKTDLDTLATKTDVNAKQDSISVNTDNLTFANNTLDTSIPLSNFATKTDVNVKQDKLTSGKNITISENNLINTTRDLDTLATKTEVSAKQDSISVNTNNLTFSNNTLDTTVPLSDFATKTEVSAKQDKLEDGYGIDIDKNIDTDKLIISVDVSEIATKADLELKQNELHAGSLINLDKDTSTISLDNSILTKDDNISFEKLPTSATITNSDVTIPTAKAVKIYVDDISEDLTETIENKLSAVYTYAGSVVNYNSLPKNLTLKNKGEVYNVEESNGNTPAGTNYVWDGTKWDALAGIVDLSSYALKADVTNEIVAALPNLSDYIQTESKTNLTTGEILVASGNKKAKTDGVKIAKSIGTDHTTIPTSHAISAALNNKSNTNHTHTAAEVGARPDHWVPSWEEVTSKPDTFVASPHTHPEYDYTGDNKSITIENNIVKMSLGETLETGKIPVGKGNDYSLSTSDGYSIDKNSLSNDDNHIPTSQTVKESIDSHNNSDTAHSILFDVIKQKIDDLEESTGGLSQSFSEIESDIENLNTNKQETLINSGSKQNIKTIDGQTILGTGNIDTSMKYIVLDSNVASYITSITTAIQYIATNNKVGFYKYITGNTIYEIPPFTKSEGTYTIVKVFRYVQNNQNNSFLENYRITNSTNTVVVYSSADLSNLATNTSLNDGLDAKQDKLKAGKNITITESGGTTTIDTIRDLDTLATIESVSEEAGTRSEDILAINTKHDALEGKVNTNTTDISDLSSIVGSKQDNIIASETSKYYRGDKTWQTLNAAAAGARASNWVPSWTEVTGKPTTFTPSDHAHDSLYYQKSELQNNQISARRLQVNFNGVPTSNLGTPTIAEMALFQEQFNNKIEFWDINKLKFETFDGTDWTDITSTIPEVQKEKFVGGDASSNIAIPNGAVQYAITIKAHGYVYLNALYSYWSSNGNHTTVQVWKKQDTNENWIQHTNSTQSVSAWPGHLFLPFDAIPFASTVNSQYFNEVKFIFTPNWTHATNNISLYNFQIWGGYPAGKRNIYTTDHEQNVTFPANLSGKAITGTEYYIGANKLNASHIGARSDTWNPNWSDIIGKPIKFNPADHTHPIEDVIGLVLALNKKLETISPTTLGNNKILLGKGDNTTVQASDKEIVGTIESNNNVPTNTAVMNYVSGLNLATKAEVNAKQDPLSFSNGLTKTGNNVTANLNSVTNLTEKNKLSLKVSSDSSNNLRVVPEVATTSKFGLIKSGSTGTEVKINSDGIGSVDTYTKLQIDTTFAKKEDLTNIYKFKGSKQKFSDLLLTGNTVGDVWNVIEANGNIPAGTNYAWDGVSNRWEVLGGITDLSNYVTLSVTNALAGRVTTLETDTSRIGHKHNISDITDLQNGLDAKQNKLTQSHNAGNGISIENSTGKISINNTVLTTSSMIEDSKIPNTVSRTDHTHTISNITNLQAQLDSKSPMNHTHPEYVYNASDGIEIVDKKIKLTQAKLNEISGKLDTINSGTLTAETILTGTGSTKNVKSSGKTIVTTLGTDDTTVPTSKAVNTALSGKANSTHTHPISQVTGLDDKLNTKLNNTGPDTFDGDLTVTGKIIGHNETKVIYGTQTKATAIWTGEAPWLTELYDGLEIDYFLPFAGGSNVTLDLTLKDGSSTGPINCYYRGNATTGSRLNTHLSEGNWGKLKYFINGFGTVTTPVWILQGTYDSGNTYDRLYYSNAIQVAEPIYRYKWIMQDVDGGWRPLFPTNKTGTTVVSPFAISTSEFMIGSPILQYNTTKTISANGTVSNLYLSMPIEVRYNINVASLTNYKNVYLKGTIGPRGGFVIDQTTYYVQDLPTVKDNFYYMYIGYMYSTTSIRFDLNHPIYFVNEDGKVCTYVGGVQGPKGEQGIPGNNGKDGTDGANGAPGTAATIEVGTVTTGAAGTNATITNVGSPSAAKFNFTIPRGATGTNGTNGAPGKDGVDATIELGTVSTGAAGSNVVITNTGTPTKAKFNFTIPKGDTGTFDSSELNNYLNKVTGGTVSGDLISSGQTTVQNSGVPLYIKRLSNTANIYAGAMFERGTSGTAGVNNQGIGMYFKSNDTAGNMDFAGIIGGRLAVATSGAEVGELVFGPAYAGVDPYARSDFRVRARNGSIADAYINGDMFVGTTPAKLATENYVDTKLSTVYKYKGSKQNKSLLPSTGNVTGDVWNVVEADGNTPAGTNYVWDGSAWDALGGTIDLSNYALTSQIPTGMEYVSNKNTTNGYAGLDSNKKIKIEQLPTHSHTISDVTNLQTELDKKLTKSTFTNNTILLGTGNNDTLKTSSKTIIENNIGPNNNTVPTSLAVKTYVDTEIGNVELLPGPKGVGYYYSSSNLAIGATSAVISTIQPSGIEINDFILSKDGNLFKVTSKNSTTATIVYQTTLKGDNGTNGTDGAPGAAATISVGTVTTGNPGTLASITNTGTSSAAKFNFTIPKAPGMYFADITLPIVIKVGQDLTVNKSDIVPTGISTGDFLLISETTSSINPTKYNVLYKIKSTTTTLVKLEGTNGITTFTPETKAPTELGSFPGGDYWNISGKYLKITYAPGFVKGKRYAVSTIYGDSGHQYYFEFTYGAFADSNHKYQVIPFITHMGNVASCDVSPTDLKLSTRNDSLTHEDWGIPTLYELH